MDSIKEQYVLDYETADKVSRLIMQFCKNINTKKSDALRHRITAEECMLNWMDYGLGGGELIVTAGSFLGEPYITLQMQGKQCDPFIENEEDTGSFSGSILRGLNISPSYSYKKGYNRVHFRLKRKASGQLVRLVVIIAAATLFSLAGIYIFPEKVCKGLLTWFITPLYETFFKVLGCIAGPMIFMSVSWGIYGIGDATTFGKVGKKLIGRFLAAVFFCSALTVCIYPLLGPSLSGKAVDSDH